MSLRERLRRGDVLVAPGVYDAFTARLVEMAGFEAAFLSGAGVSYSLLAQPDIGLVHQGEMVQRVETIAGAVRLPILADGDNGHGNALNVVRTVRAFERAGAAAIQLEDQCFPKRCGHLAGKRLVSDVEMVGKIRAACATRSSRDFLVIGRTDARAVLGLDEAIRRARLYLEAGADVLFVEAPASRDEMRAIAKELPGVPLVANMVEGGKTPMLDVDELANLGFSIVLFPNSLTRVFAKAGADLLGDLRARGTTAGHGDRMVSFDALNALVGLEATAALESKYVPKTDSVTKADGLV